MISFLIWLWVAVCIILTYTRWHNKKKSKQNKISNKVLSIIFLSGFIVLGISALATYPVTSSGTNTSKQSNQKVFKVKVTKISTSDSDDWVVNGTTDAPDGSVILAVDNKNATDGDNSNASESDNSDLPKVKNGKFKANISPIFLSNGTSYKEGQQFKTLIFAVTNYHEDDTDDVSGSLVKNLKSTTLTLSSSQVDYINNLHSDSSDDTSSDNSSSELSAYQKVQQEADETSDLSKTNIKNLSQSAINAKYDEAKDNAQSDSSYEWVNSIKSIKVKTAAYDKKKLSIRVDLSDGASDTLSDEEEVSLDKKGQELVNNALISLGSKDVNNKIKNYFDLTKDTGFKPFVYVYDNDVIVNSTSALNNQFGTKPFEN